MLRDLLGWLLDLAKVFFRARPDAIAQQAHAAGVAETQRDAAESGAAAVQAVQAAAEHVDAHNAAVLADAGAAPDSVRPDVKIDDPFERD